MDWKTELLKLKEEAIAEVAPPPDPIELDKKILQDISALRLLREMNEFLFDGKARVQTFIDEQKYSIIVALLWEGPIGSPKPISTKSKKLNKLFVGVIEQQVYVNGYKLQQINIETLQEALLLETKKMMNTENGTPIGK